MKPIPPEKKLRRKLNFDIYWPQVEVPPSTLRFLQYYTMILQRPRIIVGDAEFEPGTSPSEVWHTTNVAITSPFYTGVGACSSCFKVFNV